GASLGGLCGEVCRGQLLDGRDCSDMGVHAFGRGVTAVCGKDRVRQRRGSGARIVSGGVDGGGLGGISRCAGGGERLQSCKCAGGGICGGCISFAAAGGEYYVWGAV